MEGTTLLEAFVIKPNDGRLFAEVHQEICSRINQKDAGVDFKSVRKTPTDGILNDLVSRID